MWNWLKQIFTTQQTTQPAIQLQKQEQQERFFVLKWHFQDDGRAKMECDWDDAFIKELRRRGFTGSSDDAVVQKFLTYIHSNGLGDDLGDDNDYK